MIPYNTGGHHQDCPGNYAEIPYNLCVCPEGWFDRMNEKAKETKRHGSPTFYGLLDEMATTHDKKSHDYASDGDPYANYKFSGYVSSLFAHSPDDAGFAGRIAEKIMRLSVLGKRGTAPKNESIADTERDIAVISALWMAMRRDKASVNQMAMPGDVHTVSPKKKDLSPEVSQALDTIIAYLEGKC